MNESALMILLRLVHIFSGIFWAGGVAIAAWFILPAQSTVGQAGMAFMRELMIRRRLRVYMTVAMILTLLSGLTMYAWLVVTTHGEWARSTPARILGIGALAALIAGGIGGSAGARTGRKMDEVGAKVQAGGGTPTEDQRLEIATTLAQFQKSLRIVALLLIVAIAAMASARYL
jgi:uncharacterized membrane protein